MPLLEASFEIEILYNIACSRRCIINSHIGPKVYTDMAKTKAPGVTSMQKGRYVAAHTVVCNNSDYYINTSELPGFFLLLKNHFSIARSEDTLPHV